MTTKVKTAGLLAGLLLGSLAILTLLPAHAAALQVSSSAVDHLGAPDITLTVSSNDPTGTAVITVNGVAQNAVSVVPGQRVALGRIAMGVGRHTVRAMVRSSDGVVRSAPLVVRVWGKPGRAALVTPVPGSYAARRASLTVRSGASTRRIEVFLNGSRIVDVATTDDARVRLGEIKPAAGVNHVRLVAHNPVARTESSFRFTRLDYPWSTCIIVDKSDYRLYWIKDGRLVASYPVAHGRINARTPAAVWRIDAKYHSDPNGVYGPRKMRLFRKTASGYVYTRYLIHGTNRPWSIGTMASAGCIRMYNRDVLELFPQVPLRTMVLTRD